MLDPISIKTQEDHCHPPRQPHHATIKVATALLPSSHQVSAISSTHPLHQRSQRKPDIKIQKPSRRPYLEGPRSFHHRNPRPWVSPVFLLQSESSSNTSKNGVSASPFIKTKGLTSDFNQSLRGRRCIILFVLGSFWS